MIRDQPMTTDAMRLYIDVLVMSRQENDLKRIVKKIDNKMRKSRERERGRERKG